MEKLNFQNLGELTEEQINERIMNCLENITYDFRTIESISKETGIPKIVIKGMLYDPGQKNKIVKRYSYFKGDVFTTVRRYEEMRESQSWWDSLLDTLTYPSLRPLR